MQTRNTKFQPRLMQQETQEAWEENGESLKERFGAKEKQEVKVERKPVGMATSLWNGFTRIVLVAFAVVGAFSLANPLLREYLYALLSQFWRSIF